MNHGLKKKMTFKQSQFRRRRKKKFSRLKLYNRLVLFLFFSFFFYRTRRLLLEVCTVYTPLRKDGIKGDKRRGEMKKKGKGKSCKKANGENE